VTHESHYFRFQVRHIVDANLNMSSTIARRVVAPLITPSVILRLYRPSPRPHGSIFTSFIYRRLLSGNPARQRLECNEPPKTTPSDEPESKPRSGHVAFYRELLPAMIPIFLVGSAVYVVRSASLIRLTTDKILILKMFSPLCCLWDIGTVA
jgi:hypothetical protein